jgi:signal transduction histidine kinase
VHSREELVSGRIRWSDLTPSEWRSTDRRAVEQLTSAGVASLREKEYTRHDGSRVPVLVGSAMLGGTGGDCISFVLDLRGSKEAAAAVEHLGEALAASVARAEAANRELEAFSYSVAHDLRAPLRGMNGFARMLIDTYRDKLDADGQDWLQEITLNAGKMGALIDGLLALARLSRSELRRERVDLSSVARDAARQLSVDEPDRVVEVVVQDGLAAEVDAPLVRALLENLLGNAWKFTSKVSVARI